ncbi:hypothetical protein RZG19_002143 [Citrobacter freundii]|uniref:hypothetical protein n=1 Tax=Citrobacter freundii complex TaxID=1344959 RepID=UPI0015E95D70|nr:hypothetical protein [Citrobacter freundii]EKW7317060.1 hypothetical protein [Citrobacter freundii]ELO5435230.1 hypothetical protein [Citrobacter freundii]MBJ9196056.1 hypothetical protein [Citrobacter freundii]MCC2938163.1 hypothetical protein [Citrobacter freundii]MDE9644275.1 hypothetical protein [Citrobacter freundii]
MSGKKTKAAGQQVTENSSGKASPTEVASVVVTDSPGHESPVVLSGHYLPVGSQPVSVQTGVSESAKPHALVPDTYDVVALEVRAVRDTGFYRCGRFWPREPVHVFASDDPLADNAANNAHSGIQADCFISHEDAARLKAEPMLVVTVLDAVAEQQ